MKKKHKKHYILTKTVHLVKKLTKSNDFPRRWGKSDFYISLRDLKTKQQRQVKGEALYTVVYTCAMLKVTIFKDKLEQGVN